MKKNIFLTALLAIALLLYLVSAGAMVDDADTKSLLHFNGANNSTVFADESGKTWTVNGTAKLNTAQSVFGGASATFPGTGIVLPKSPN